MKKVVWEIEIEQEFKGGIVEFYTEHHVGSEDLCWALQKMRRVWLEEVLEKDGGRYHCADVKVLSARKVCELT